MLKGILIIVAVFVIIFIVDIILDITGIAKNLPKDGGFN